jgi:hypothetical protein
VASLVNHGLNTSGVGSVRLCSSGTCWNHRLYTRLGKEGPRNVFRSTFGSLDVLVGISFGPVCIARNLATGLCVEF